MTPKEFIDENYFSLTIDCKREISEIYQALEDYTKTKQLTLTDVSQQRELLLSYEEWLNEYNKSEDREKQVDKYLAK
jgi:hypothetical protein